MTNKIMFTLRLNLARSDRHDFICNFGEYLLWVKANEVNYLAVSSQRVQRSLSNVCKPSKEYVGNARITSLVGK